MEVLGTQAVVEWDQKPRTQGSVHCWKTSPGHGPPPAHLTLCGARNSLNTTRRVLEADQLT